MARSLLIIKRADLDLAQPNRGYPDPLSQVGVDAPPVYKSTLDMKYKREFIAHPPEPASKYGSLHGDLRLLALLLTQRQQLKFLAQAPKPSRWLQGGHTFCFSTYPSALLLRFADSLPPFLSLHLSSSSPSFPLLPHSEYHLLRIISETMQLSILMSCWFQSQTHCLLIPSRPRV